MMDQFEKDVRIAGLEKAMKLIEDNMDSYDAVVDIIYSEIQKLKGKV